MKLAELHRGLINEIRGLYGTRPKARDQFSPLEQLVLFGEVGNELIDFSDKNSKSRSE